VLLSDRATCEHGVPPVGELVETHMGERQRRYRASYRERVAGWYNGWLHVVVIFVVGFTAIYVYLANVTNVQWWELLVIPVVFLADNYFEWALHRHVMHRPSNMPMLRAIYNRHTLQHHQFFTDEEMRFADQADFRVTFFPPYALVGFTLGAIPIAIVAGLLISPNVAWLGIATTTGFYLTYEFMHFCCHIEDNWFVRNMPLVNTIRRHHAAHHNQGLMMERNMNVTFPIMDYFFGTSDLNRGLLGHLFNGYDTRFVKTDMRRTSRTPKVQPSMPAEGTAPAE